MVKKFILFLMLMMMIIPMGFAANTDLEFSVTLRPETTWDKVSEWFQGNMFTVSQSETVIGTVASGDIITSRFRVTCTNPNTPYVNIIRHTFHIKYGDMNGKIISDGQSVTMDWPCKSGESFIATATNIKIPSLPTTTCDKHFKIVMEHTALTSGYGYGQVDANPTSANPFGSQYDSTYFSARELIYNCGTLNPCQGITGQYKGSAYCNGNDVVRLKYTDIVKNGVCLDSEVTIKSCGSGYTCENAACVAITPTEKTYYYLSDDKTKCLSGKYMSDENIPSGGYSTLTKCKAAIVPIIEPPVVPPIVEPPICAQVLTNAYQFDKNTCKQVQLSNACLPANHYKTLAECETKIDTTPIVGEKDSNGCYPSAGYTWCAASKSCIRTWETSCSSINTNTTDDNTNDDVNNLPWYTRFWNWLLLLFS